MSIFWEPSADETAQWSSRRRQATNDLERNKARLGLARSQAQQQQGIDTANLTREYDQMRNKLPGEYAGRGLLNSGIYGQGLKQYGAQRQAAMGDLGQKYQQLFQQQSLEGEQQVKGWWEEMQHVAEAETLRRQEIAKEVQLLEFYRKLSEQQWAALG